MNDVARAEKEVATRLRQLDDATDAARLADAAFLADGSDKSLDAASKARLRVERATSLHASAVETLDAARAAQHSAEVERTRAQVVRDLETLPHYLDALEPLHDRLIALDRQLDDLMLQYLRTTTAGAEAYDAAYARALSVGLTLGSIVRPTLDDAILQGRIAATEAREAEGREDLHDLVKTIDNNWKVSSLNASERAALARVTSRNEQSDNTHNIARITLATLHTTLTKE